MTGPRTAELPGLMAGRDEETGQPQRRSRARALGVERFAPIGLDELVGQAELMTRVDRKYLMPIEVAAAAVAGLDAGTRVLEIDGTRDFAYDSVYFDTADALSYRLTAQKRRRRFKVRTRSYLDTGGCFLEIKTKSGRGATVKQRTEYRVEDRARLTSYGRDYARQVLCAQGHDSGLVGRLEPSLVSRYHRTTLLLPEGSRATIDTQLQWFDVDPDATRDGDLSDAIAGEVRLPTQVIVETKSAGGASELDRALWRSGHRPTGISKFGTGTAALHPELPNNKWSRQLRGPFNLELQ
jgi:hypothetical protein